MASMQVEVSFSYQKIGGCIDVYVDTAGFRTVVTRQEFKAAVLEVWLESVFSEK